MSRRAAPKANPAVRSTQDDQMHRRAVLMQAPIAARSAEVTP